MILECLECEDGTGWKLILKDKLALRWFIYFSFFLSWTFFRIASHPCLSSQFSFLVLPLNVIHDDLFVVHSLYPCPCCKCFFGRCMVLFIMECETRAVKINYTTGCPNCHQKGVQELGQSHRNPSIRQVNQVVKVPIGGRGGHQ